MSSIFCCFSANNVKSDSSSVHTYNEKYDYRIPEGRGVNRSSFGKLSVFAGRVKEKLSKFSTSKNTRDILSESERDEKVSNFLDFKECDRDAGPIKVKFNSLLTKVLYKTKKMEIKERKVVNEEIMKKLNNKEPLDEYEKKEVDVVNEWNLKRAKEIIIHIEKIYDASIRDGYKGNEIVLKVKDSLDAENKTVLKIKVYYLPASKQQEQEMLNAQGFFFDVLKDFNKERGENFKEILSYESMSIEDFMKYINMAKPFENGCVTVEAESVHNQGINNIQGDQFSAEDAEVAAFFERQKNKSKIKETVMDGANLDGINLNYVHEYINTYEIK